MQNIPVIAGSEGRQKQSVGDKASGIVQAGKHRKVSTKDATVSSIGLPGLSRYLTSSSEDM